MYSTMPFQFRSVQVEICVHLQTYSSNVIPSGSCEIWMLSNIEIQDRDMSYYFYIVVIILSIHFTALKLQRYKCK